MATGEKIRIFALGGLDEDGKNMYCVEIDNQIYVIEAGFKYPDGKETLGIEYLIPDFSYLLENKDRVAGVIITHGHDDVMGALPHLLKQLKTDVYTSPIVARELKNTLDKDILSGLRIHEVQRHDQKRIGKRKVIFFPVTHSYPQCFGIAISSSQGYIVYSGEFIEDYDALDDLYRGDFTTSTQLRQEGVLVLMQDSKLADVSGHTAPNHRVAGKLDNVLEKYADKRIIIATYTQGVFRIQEIINECMAFDRKIVVANQECANLLKDLYELGYDYPKDTFYSPEQAAKKKIENPVVLLTGQGKAMFKTLSNICNNEDETIDFEPDDVIVIGCHVLPGAEREFKQMENDIYKQEGEIIMLDKNVSSMHPSQDDLKMMIFSMHPKYYIPVKGEYRKLIMNSEIALQMNMKPSEIIILDNGQVATFENKKLRSCSMELELHDTMIDGKENWDMAGVVLKDREILSTDGVMILAIGIDSKTKKIINGPDVQTRGLIYLKDAEYISSDVAQIMEETINTAVENKTYDNLETRSEIREKVSRYLFRQIAKKPMILPVILEINTSV